MRSLREDAREIAQEAIKAVLPEPAVIKALTAWKTTRPALWEPKGRLLVIALGKAAWRMAQAAGEIFEHRMHSGLIITKYGHAGGPLKGFDIIEAGHPLPDENSVAGATKALEMVSGPNADDQVVMLISGGGSSLFEKPMKGVTLREIQDLTDQLLEKGADIGEINTIRKRLSSVKGGRFAEACGEARVMAVVLSDVLGDRLDVIASGPITSDRSTTEQALLIAEKYRLQISEACRKALTVETPKQIPNCEAILAGNVKVLCEAAAEAALQKGYQPVVMTTTLDCEAREAGRMMASIANEITNRKKSPFALTPPCAVIAGGETVVHVAGNGKGGRNQEMALSAALGIQGNDRVVILSVGSDGTDGPTEAAGGLADGGSVSRMIAAGIKPAASLANNDAYHALAAGDDLVITGPTGTNVNDLMMALCR